MQILHRTEQGTHSLNEFYRAIAHPLSRGLRMIQELMLLLLDEIEAFPSDIVVWGVTSKDSGHWYQVELRKDGESVPTPPFVSIFVHSGGWSISCPMPPELAPWPDAIVDGYAEQLDEAVRRVRLAFFWAKLLPTP